MPQQIATVTLDGNGAGVVRLPPAPLMRYWRYNRISITIDSGVSGATNNASCRLYKGEPNAGSFVTESRIPWGDTAGFDPETGKLTSPDYWSLVWADCDPGAVATVIAEFYETKL